MANEKRLVDANQFCCAYEFIKKHLVAGDSEFLQGYEAGLRGAFDAINTLDTIDAVEVVHGRWVNPYINRYGHPCHCCSECGFKASYQDKNYCPNCGAKMDGGVADGNQ